jgi:hypothetical protein
MQGVEIFRQKHVLLFISSLDSIEDEISLLKSIYERLQENSKEAIKGFKKEDFKILWIPIVDKWDEVREDQFRNLKASMKWYVPYVIQKAELYICLTYEFCFLSSRFCIFLIFLIILFLL